jgi:SAM-dependent methyltransferase
MARVEDAHWWFVSRRRVARSVITGLNLPPRAKILEVGSGTGGNLALLESWGNVHAIEMDGGALEMSLRKKGRATELYLGRCPDRMPETGCRYDLICLFDVLEHIQNDVAALRCLLALLAPGGRILITVPAYPWLWSSHDVYLHHFRRYTRASLANCVQEAGGLLGYATYFSTVLFPLAVGARFVGKLLGLNRSLGSEIPSRVLNGCLSTLAAIEPLILRFSRLAYGMSIIAVVHARCDHKLPAKDNACSRSDE